MAGMIVDVMVFSALVIAGAAGIRTARQMGLDAPGAMYWLLAGLGLVYLGLDELLNVHEVLGREMWQAGVPAPPFVNHLDDVFVLIYTLSGLAVSLRYWRELFRFRAVLRPFALALAATGLSIGVDAEAPVEGFAPFVEELSELTGAMLFFVAFRRRLRIEQAVVGRVRAESGPAASPAD